jgi:hypothetical protein
MPRFPVNFRRKSTAAEDQNGPVAEPSFRVLERPNSGNVKSFDGGVRLSRTAGGTAKTNSHHSAMEDNLFAGLNSSRYVLFLFYLPRSIRVFYISDYWLSSVIHSRCYSGIRLATLLRCCYASPQFDSAHFCHKSCFS